MMPSTISNYLGTEFPLNLPWEVFHYGVLESASQTRFLNLTVELRDFIPEQYDAGLLFGPTAELRWRRLRSGKFRLVCIDDLGRDWLGEPVPLKILEPDPQHWPQTILMSELADLGEAPTVKTIYYRFELKIPVSNGRAPETKEVFLFRCASLAPGFPEAPR